MILSGRGSIGPLNCRWVLFRKRSDFLHVAAWTKALCVRVPGAPRVVTEAECVGCEHWESRFESERCAREVDMDLLAPSIDRDVLRLRDEFISLPGLTLTPAQASRLLAVRIPQAARILTELEEEGLLECSGTGVYFRPHLGGW